MILHVLLEIFTKALLTIAWYIMDMSTEKKNLIKRDYALNDATSGQMGEEPRSVYEPETLERNKDSRKKAARKLSTDI